MKKNKLKDIPGRRIRCQYFNLPIYLILFIDVEFALCWLVLNKDFSLATLSSMTDLWLISLVAIVPLAILSVLNRLFFGRTVAVADEKGLHTERGFIPWNSMMSIAYSPSVPSKHTATVPNGLDIVCLRGRRSKEELFIPGMPVYAMRVIRRYKPDIRIRVSSDTWFLVGGTVVITVLLMVFGYFDIV